MTNRIVMIIGVAVTCAASAFCQTWELPVETPGDLSVQPTSAFSGFCPVPVSYCPATANSTGAPAVLDWMGSVEVSDDDLTFTTTSIPPGSLVTMFYGAGRASIPFGDGTLCVDPRGLGYVVRFRVQQLPGFGSSILHTFDFDAAFVPPEAAIRAGATFHFQTWFRDSQGNVNFSNALEMSFCP